MCRPYIQEINNRRTAITNNNWNNNTKSHYVKCQNQQGEANCTMQNNTITVNADTVQGVMAVTVLTSMGKLLLLYIPKTSHDFTTFSQKQ
jgi:hypothetical protein